MHKSKISRNTLETKIELDLAVDGSGDISINLGIGFFDHILKARAFYAGFDLHINCQGDLHLDSHHTLEDIGLTLGAAFKEALGDKKGIELNTSGLRSKLKTTFPKEGVLNRYQKLGGQVITIGSDAHFNRDYYASVLEGMELLKSLGFTKISSFSHRTVKQFDISKGLDLK